MSFGLFGKGVSSLTAEHEFEVQSTQLNNDPPSCGRKALSSHRSRGNHASTHSLVVCDFPC